MKNGLLLLIVSMLLTGCLTMSGTYRVRAVDAEGQDLNQNIVMTAEGRHIYTARNAICSLNPGATVLIEDVTTGAELKRESPYKCRAARWARP